MHQQPKHLTVNHFRFITFLLAITCVLLYHLPTPFKHYINTCIGSVFTTTRVQHPRSNAMHARHLQADVRRSIKLANCCGRGFSFQRQSADEMYDQQTRRVTNGGPIWSCFYVVSYSKNKATWKCRPPYRLPFFVVTVLKWQVTCHGSTISLANCLWKLNHAHKSCGRGAGTCKAHLSRSIKSANFCGRGLVARENRPIISMNN